MFTVKETEKKTISRKKTLNLKNISVKDLVLVDTDTGEDITEQVVSEIPQDISCVSFKLTFELSDENE